MFFANDGACLPITNTATLVGDFRALINVYSIRNTRAITGMSIALTVRFILVTQMLVEVATRLLVSKDILVNCFVMEADFTCYP
jgi:hypothetical protein